MIDWQWLIDFFDECCVDRCKPPKKTRNPYAEVRRVNGVPLCEDVLRKHQSGSEDWEGFNIGYEVGDDWNEYMVIVCKDDKGNSVILTLPKHEDM